MPYIPPQVAESEQTERLAYHLGPAKQGKVRDIYDLDDHLFMVTTDRASSFDRVLGRKIPNKGIVLNGVSVWWLTRSGIRVSNNHLRAVGPSIGRFLQATELRQDIDLQSRSIVVAKRKPLPMECVARGYITGSGWKSYVAEGHVCGIELPKGLREGDRLEAPIFTPTTKSDDHDLPLTEQEAVELVGRDTYELAKHRTLSVYAQGADRARQAGIIVADTKFEMDETGCLLDEVLTPDSSRFWPADRWNALQANGGGTPPSLDKQYLRDILAKVGFAKLSPEEAGRVEIIDEVCHTLSEIYLELLRTLTGYDLPQFQREVLGITAA